MIIMGICLFLQSYPVILQVIPLIDSQLEKMDHATVKNLMKVYPDKVSANIQETKSACHVQDEKTNKEALLSQNELLSNAGSCLMENSDGDCGCFYSP